MWKLMVVAIAVAAVLLINHKLWHKFWHQLPFFPIFYNKADAHAKDRSVTEKKIDLDLDGRTEIVQKLHTKDGLTIRILDEIKTAESLSLAQHTFPLGEEGFIFFKTHFSNLGFADINDDGQLEILVSVFDKKSQKNDLKVLQWNKTKGILEHIHEEY